MQSNDGSAGALIFVIIILALYIALFVWLIKLKGKMVQRGADIPTSLLLFVPIVNLYWMYKWFMGVEHVTGGQVNGVLVFALNFIIGPLPLFYAGYQVSQALKSPPTTNFSPMNPQAVNPNQGVPNQAPQPTQFNQQAGQPQPNQFAQNPSPQPQNPNQPQSQPQPQPTQPTQAQPQQNPTPPTTESVQPQSNPNPNPQAPQTPGQSVQPGQNNQ